MKICAKCSGTLARGYTPEARDMSYKVDQWVEGEPKRGLFGFKMRGKRRFDMEAWRCEKCGFVELYAPGN